MSQALLLQLNAYLGDQNVERSIGTFNLNIPNTNGTIATLPGLVLHNGGTFVYTPPAGNKITAIITNVPLSALITFAASAGGGTLTKTIQQVAVYDQELISITFTNNDIANDATLTVIYG